jgi:MatE
MVGQNLGAGRPDRAERAVWTAAGYNMVFLGVVGLTFLLGAPLIARLFSSDPAVVPFAVGCLRTVSLGFLFYACGMVLTQAFNGAGDTWTPTIINLFVFWLFEIPGGVVAVDADWIRRARRVHRADCRLLDARARQHRDFPSRTMENQEDLITSAARSRPSNRPLQPRAGWRR